jgi:hypothetical protein
MIIRRYNLQSLIHNKWHSYVSSDSMTSPIDLLHNSWDGVCGGPKPYRRVVKYTVFRMKWFGITIKREVIASHWPCPKNTWKI